MTLVTADLAGKSLALETGSLANQADGAVVARMGDCMILATAVAGDPREGIDFFPLLIDYEEKMYAAGKIPGSRYIKREGRPSENAILTGRRTDRPIRPLFPEGLRNDVQVIVTTLSADLIDLPDVLAINGASAALCLSPIPFDGPVAAVRVGRVDGQFVINPTFQDLDNSDLSLLLAQSRWGLVELELTANEITEDDLVAAIEFARPYLDQLMAVQDELVRQAGKPKLEFERLIVPDEIRAAAEAYGADVRAAIQAPSKQMRQSASREMASEIRAKLTERFPEADPAHISEAVESLIKKQIRALILEEGRRPEGRTPDEIRPITCQVGLLPRAHGSALFTRGQTQVLTVATLGGIGEEQLLDGLTDEESKRFMHHYNFPPYSVGEVRPLRGASRRDVGHGSLAEKSLLPVIPPESEFPYTIRLVSEVLESNASSSMAATCGSTLALMDAGVPIRAPVSGVSIGMVSDADRYVLLTDIQDVEDFHGDMDFKIAGTRQGITGIQMDTKLKGLPYDRVPETLEKARVARLHVLDRMAETLPAPRPELSPLAPRVFVLEIHPDKIGDVIGPGGKVIKKLEADYDCKIDIEQDGRVFVAATDAAKGEAAREAIELITRDVVIGETYVGKVVGTTSFGAFVELLPGRDGMVHISELARERVERVEDVVKVGDEVTVKVVDIDPQGKVRLTRKALLPGGEDTSSDEGGRPERSRGGRGEGRTERRPTRRRNR
ncbi:hypothetical protein AMK68_05395 [candidate division KD3-62 bacterium DG_56]|uniref:Polyribonucleotide nucleotidyltransferase n=1 Tax=candidate division KD3-62 bacterium DG_56 TaxID=1704032 RepID=A0A0S7XI26_9BACT|nr:MAG: hypothetical protein AMK68_05395 [candidate division KD3-62 bacterium DG_56]